MLVVPKVKGSLIVINAKATEALEKSIKVESRTCIGSIHTTYVEVVDSKHILKEFENFLKGQINEIPIDPDFFKYAVNIVKELQSEYLLFFHPTEVSFKNKVLVNREFPGFIHSQYDQIYTNEGAVILEDYAKRIISPYFLIHTDESGSREIKKVEP